MTSSDKPANPLRGNDWNTSGPSLDLPADDDSLRVAAASQRALIRVLATAQRYRIPPSDLVDRLSHEFPGYEGKAMGQVAQLLAAGVPVIDALEQTPTALDPISLMALRLASETGTLPEMYRILLRADADAGVNADALDRASETDLLGLAIGLLVALNSIAFLMVFIVPTLEEMFNEFGLELPAPMILLVSISSFGAYLFLLGLALIVLLLVIWVYRTGIRWRPWKPATRKASPSASLPALLAIVVGSGRPLASGLATLARFHPAPRIRNQLLQAFRSIDQGENAWTSLFQQGLLRRSESESLLLAPDRTTEAWLLQQASTARRRRSYDISYGSLRLVSLTGLLVLAAVVGLAAIAVFATLYRMVESLA